MTAVLDRPAETEQAVGPFRARYDRAAAWGVPAHVTVLYPFLPPSRIDDGYGLAMAASIHRSGVPSGAGPIVRTAIRQVILPNQSYPVRRAEVGMRVGGEPALEDYG